jgi:phosphoribosyl 1,2-cyclic phosphodiesterase
MKLRVLGSSSKGNCYLLRAWNQVLIIEAGVKLYEVKKALSFRTDNIVGCLISHSHNDHAGYIKEYSDAGITVLTSEHVLEAKELSKYNNRVKVIYPEHGYRLGEFMIIPFEVQHDVPCLGFMIYHPECGNFMFITDTYMCEYTFSNLSHVIIECNYSDQILEHNIIYKGLNPVIRPRLLYSHMELENCKNILRGLNLSQVINIVLIHLSDGNSNEEQFVKEISEEFLKTTIAARKDIEIDFNVNKSFDVTLSSTELMQITDELREKYINEVIDKIELDYPEIVILYQ